MWDAGVQLYLESSPLRGERPRPPLSAPSHQAGRDLINQRRYVGLVLGDSLHTDVTVIKGAPTLMQGGRVFSFPIKGSIQNFQMTLVAVN